MIKEVRKYGDSLIMTFNYDDKKMYNIKIGSKIRFKIIEVEDGKTN